MSSYKFARRSFIRGLGASAAVMPLLHNIERKAIGADPPRRLLVILKPVGVVQADYTPTGTPTPQGITTFGYRPISAPFQALKDKTTIITGLNLVAETLNLASDPTRHGGTDTHEGGVVALMTGVPTLGKIGTQDHAAGGPSMDQVFLDKSPYLGGAASAVKTPFGSLQVGTDTRADRNEISPRVMSYKAPLPGVSNPAMARQPLFPEIRPINVFNRIFGGAVLPTGTTTDFAALRAQKKSLLDYMNKDLTRLRGLVPSNSRAMIDAHASSIQSLEKSIAAAVDSAERNAGGGAGGAGGAVGGACAKPTGVTSFPDNPDYWYDTRADKETYHPHEEVGRLHLKIIKAAFQCDLVRVATFMWSPGTNMVVFGGLSPGMQVGGHHVMSHGGGFGAGWLTQIDQWYSKTTVSALQEFVTPDIGGTGDLLDNTAVIYSSEVGQASHNWSNIPTILIGGKNLGIAHNGGRFMKPPTNRPWNDLWLALAPAFGVTGMTRLGGSTQSSGPLPFVLTA